MKPTTNPETTMDTISLAKFSDLSDSSSIRDAIASAIMDGYTLNNYASPVDDAGRNISAERAEEIAREDISLVYLARGVAPTYRVDLDTLTVFVTDAGGTYDMNATGEPCADLSDLRAWIAELCEQGAFDVATRDALLTEAV